MTEKINELLEKLASAKSAPNREIGSKREVNIIYEWEAKEIANRAERLRNEIAQKQYMIKAITTLASQINTTESYSGAVIARELLDILDDAVIQIGGQKVERHKCN